MLPVQMTNNSFDSNESGMVKHVKSENLHDRKNFTDIYESTSSVYRNVRDIEATDDRLLTKGSLGKSSELVTVENKKLISLKKVKSSNLSKNIKNANSRDLREKLIDLSLVGKPGRSMKAKNPDVEKIISDNSDQTIIADQVAQSAVGDDIIKSDGIHASVNSSALLISEQSKSSIGVKSLNAEKSGKNDERMSGKATAKKESARKKAGISVLDLRDTSSRIAKTKQHGSSIEIESGKLSAENMDQMRSDSAEDAKPIVVELTHVKDNFSGESKTLTTTTGSALMKQLEESVNNKIVKQSSIILKNGDSGEIKLILKPEALGKVRIRLSLNDNRVAGQIIVENAAVKEIFEQNLQSLERAFKENGFDTAALNVSVGGNGTGSGNRENNGDITKRIEMIEEIIPTMITESENLIDLIA